VIDKDGRDETVNKTRVIVLEPPIIPARDLKGRAITAPIEDEPEQNKLWQAKVDFIRKKTRTTVDDDGKLTPYHGRESAPASEIAKLRRRRPELKKLYSAADLKVGQIALAWLASKRGTYMVKILSVRNEKDDPKPWIRVHLFGASTNAAKAPKHAEKGEAKLNQPLLDFKVENRHKDRFRPWWLNNRLSAFQERKPGYSECWEDIYCEHILYICQQGLSAEGHLHDDDLKEMNALWGQDGILLMLVNAPQARLGSK
jgi:hypothetical protein